MAVAADHGGGTLGHPQIALPQRNAFPCFHLSRLANFDDFYRGRTALA
jgi:hypothetical protein